MASDLFGSVSFAPTQDNAQDAMRRGQLEGIPQAIQVLSMNLPRVRGAQTPVAPELLAPGPSGGPDPFSILIRTLIETMGPKLPKLFGGPMGGPEAFGAPMPSPSSPDPGPGPSLPVPGTPNIHFQDPGVPMPKPTRPRPGIATIEERRRSKYDI